MKLTRILFLVGLLFLGKGLFAQSIFFQDKIVCEDRIDNQRFGKSGDVFENYAIVGADKFDPLLAVSGIAYLYKWSPETCEWVQIDIIYPQDVVDGPITPTIGDHFASDVCIEGTTIAIGARRESHLGISNSGAVYIYEIEADEAVFKQKITAWDESDTPDHNSEDQFGLSLDISANSRRLIVGASKNDRQADGDPVSGIVSNAGAAYIYKRLGTSYVFENKIVASDRAVDDNFGETVSIYDNHAIVGAPFEASGIGIKEGAAYIFKWSGTEWNEIQKLEAADEEDNYRFGNCVDINGNDIAVGSVRNAKDALGDPTDSNVGAVYTYRFDGVATWNFDQKLVPTDFNINDQYGQDLELYDNYLVVGSRNDNNPDGIDYVGGAGAVFVYKRAGTWNLHQKIVAPDRDENDWFGQAVSIHGTHILSTAHYEDHNDVPPYTGGVLNHSGSAYLFGLAPDTPVITSGPSPICTIGSTVTLTITDSELYDTDYWEWYADDCGSAPIGTGSSIDVVYSGPITYYARALSDCEGDFEGECGSITLELSDGNWHQMTADGIYDTGNDVTTDAAGNVYITGQYMKKTKFLGGDFSSEGAMSGEPDTKSYVAKYDNCGNLMWMAYSDNVSPYDNDYGTTIALDETNGLVYVGGNYAKKLHFNSAIGEFGAGLLPDASAGGGSNLKGYIACFKMDNGQLNYLNRVSIDAYNEITAITINEATGDLYVGGHSGPNPSFHKIYIKRYSPTPLSLGLPIWTVLGENYGKEHLNDMDFDENLTPNGTLWVTGDYKGSLSFMGGGSITAPNVDAFVARFDDGLTPSLTGFKSGNISNKMYGNGITVDQASGKVFLTGTYRGGSSTNAFGLGQTLPLMAGGSNHAYFIAMSPSFTSVWTEAKYAYCSAGDANGVSVCYADGRVSFVGDYSRTTLTFTDGTEVPYVVFGSPNNNAHVFAVGFNAADGSLIWKNGTKDPFGATSYHLPTSIAAGPFGNSFITGGFQRDMGYLAGSPYSGNLNTPAQLATFTMRVASNAGGEFRMPGTDPTAGEQSDKSSLGNFEISTYPNPVNDIISIQISGSNIDANSTIQLLDLNGKVVKEISSNETRMQLDLSTFDAGVYLIRIVNGPNSRIKRIVKS